MDAPEPYTAAWYRQQFAGVNHRLNQQANEQTDQYTANKALQKRVDELEAAHRNDVAKIGEQNSRIEVLESWMQEIEKIRAAKKNGT